MENKIKTSNAVVTIDSEFAKWLLSLNKANRPVNEKTVAYYAKQMATGQWKYNGDSIRISKSNILLDGQHRLHAIVKSNTSQKMLLLSELPDDSFETIDRGKTRSIGDIFAIKNIPNYTNVAAIISRILNMKLSGNNGKTDTKGNLISAQDNLDFYHQNKELMDNITFLAGKYYRLFRLVPLSVYGSYLYFMYEIDKDKAEDFLSKVATGIDCSPAKYSYIYLFRQRLTNETKATSKLKDLDRNILLIKCWKHFLAGKEVKQLAWDKEREGVISFYQTT